MRLDIKAELILLNEIKVTIPNSYFNGEITIFSLKLKRLKEELEIIKVQKEEFNTIYILDIGHKDIRIGQEYYIEEEHGQNAILEYNDVVYTDEFDALFYYPQDDLGNTYSKEKTTFKLWAPTAYKVDLKIKKNNTVSVHPMINLAKGIWFYEYFDDLELAEYTYFIRANGEWHETTDPYALSSTLNHRKSIILNKEKLISDFSLESLPEFNHYTDTILYEINVRDFTSLSTVHKYKKKFLGLVEENLTTENNNPIGIDYIKYLGVTHIQLMPIFDFGSVDEYHFEDGYNWGYDPVQYNVPEGSYIVNTNNPYNRILELQSTIKRIHELGIFVNMDVVYNHMYSEIESSFNKIIPHYFFRKNSNGSFCGNDLNTKSLMVRKYIVSSLKHWATFYGIDGFRFDLMGIIDVETMNLVREELSLIRPNIMVYGEGWNMPTNLEEELRSNMHNWYKLSTIGHFNDQFRNYIRGGDETGYLVNNYYHNQKVCNLLRGSVTGHMKMFGEPYNTINYVECHDNLTLFDKISSKTQEYVHRRSFIGTALTILAQGIPFLHCGQEFFRTKNGIDNSYNLGDQINGVNWNLVDTHLYEINKVRELIDIRKKNDVFRLNSTTLIEKYTSSNYEDEIIYYYLKGFDEISEYVVIINCSQKNRELPITQNTYMLFDYYSELNESILTLEPYSLCILVK